MKWIKITILISAFLHLSVDAAPDGAPIVACDSMIPSHPPFFPQVTSSPIEIDVSMRGILPSSRINITLRATGQPFRGFLIQARTLDDNQALGRFFPLDNEAQTLNCFAMIQSAATHTNNVPKNEVVLEWEAPEIIADPIVFYFYVTIVHTSDIFWSPKRSEMYAVVPEPTTTDLPNDYDFIYEGCGDVKICFGFPSGCEVSRDCIMLSTVFDNAGDFEFELLGAGGHNYVAFGLSQSGSMAETSVIECVSQDGGIFGFTSWNAAIGRSNVRDDVPQNIIRTLETRFINARIYCKLQRDELSIVRGQTFDLRNQKHHLLIAGGTQVTINNVGPHGVNRMVTVDRRSLLVQPPEVTPPPDDPIYAQCGVTKVCFGLPEGCVDARNCDLLTTIFDNNGDFEFELLGAETHNYIAFGLSQTQTMQEASVIECVQQAGIITAHASWNSPLGQGFNTREDVPQNIIRLLESRMINNRIYCKIQRDEVSIIRGQPFNLRNMRHHLLIAGGGPLGANSVGPHGPINRAVSSERVWLAEPSAEYPIYEECGQSKVCFGLPEGCYITRDCNMLTTVFDNNGDIEFELLGLAGHQYIAFGLSQTASMFEASVIECVNQAGVITAYTSWNPNILRQPSRSDIDQSIIRTLETRLINGRIYCKLQRDEFSTVREQDFDLRNEKHHLLIAGGATVTINNVGPHGQPNRAFSPDKRWLVEPPEETTTTTTVAPPPPGNPIYIGCDVTKVCFGLPDGCVASRDCDMLTTVFDNNGDFEFELLGAVGHEYIAFGLSQTRDMGEASVIECIVRGGNVIGYTSWNHLRFNERTNVPQEIIRTLDTSFIDGRIYCKLERDTFSQVRGQDFHLEDEKHYLLIAGGTEIFAQSVGPHLDQGLSNERVNLTIPRVVRQAPLSPLVLTHGSFMIVAWIGLASIGIVLSRHFKPSWPKRKIFGKDVWFMWHVFCMFLTWALTLIGFIIIFVDVGQWNVSVHAVMGCVVLGLVSLQAIGGAARPDPKAKGRPVFNWMHKSFGHITHLLAVLTIFYAVPLSASRLPDYTTFVLVGFVSYYLLMHIILTTVDVCSQMKRKKRLGVEINKNARFELLKQTLFGIHVVIITLFVIALVLIFTLNPF